MAHVGGPEAGSAGARLESLHRARWEYLLPGEDRRHRRQELSIHGGQHDGHDPRRLRPHDVAGWPHGKAGAPEGREMMANITASVYTSHVPAIGAALDNGKSGEDYWKPVFAGYEPSKAWFKA